MKPSIFLGVLLTLSVAAGDLIHNAVETELFSVPISPNIFNWTYQEFDQQFRFQASLEGKPELPSWLRYIYSTRHHSGFIFGTPPRGTKSPVQIRVIGLNRQDYETRRLLITLNVSPKPTMAEYEVEMKIDNHNVEDLLDKHKMSRLKDIFREKLWNESSHDLYATFLASAIDLGARLPLRPNEGEGLVIRLGSTKPFSEELKRLRVEVRPLSRLPSCPREYKKTTVERLFKSADFTLDWCNFKLYHIVTDKQTLQHIEYLDEAPNSSKTEKQPRLSEELRRHYNERHVWSAPRIDDLPARSYIMEFTVAVIVPIVLMIISVAALTAVLCFHYAGIDEVSSNFVNDIFHICLGFRKKRVHKSSGVELCRYENDNTEQTQIPDNGSNKSIGVSPNNSLLRPYSPKSTTHLAGNYNRPQPPPYIGSASNSLHHRKPCNTEKMSTETGNTGSHLALEESIKLLNEAKIKKPDYLEELNLKLESKLNPVVDLTDGQDDYVPIKPETGFLPDNTGFGLTKPGSTGYVRVGFNMPESSGVLGENMNLDDIDVPELSKYGLEGVVGGHI